MKKILAVESIASLAIAVDAMPKSNKCSITCGAGQTATCALSAEGCTCRCA